MTTRTTWVDEILADVVGQWRSDELPECVEAMPLTQLLELRGELEAERERIEELIEQVDELVSIRNEEADAELTILS